MRPIIGITPSQKRGVSQFYLVKFYVEAVLAAGGLPFILPIIPKEEVIEEYLKKINGLILSGGIDPDPLIYGENPIWGMGEIDPERDYFEIKLVKGALAKKMPILGICRGCQVLNVATGGTLIQDLETQTKSIKHAQSAPKWYPTHRVIIAKDSTLFSIFKQNIKVNSTHHQAIKETGSEFKVTAWADDGVIEGIEKKKDGFAIGVQWHPEHMYMKNTAHLSLFKEFIAKIDLKS